ncbi:MAG: hypothetical protein JWM02_372 [Frankiales bacterium]|nr:hypothetical protein [Frankiales bacterium]
MYDEPVDLGFLRSSLPQRVQELATGRLRPRAWAEWLRERRLVSADRVGLAELREGREVCWPPDAAHEPLVTVRIATYQNPDVLMARALASALTQTYTNLEILVVGDAAGPETAKALDSIGDPRVRFVDLPVRTRYPERDRDRWLVAGSGPMNRAIADARGAWIAPCDDDDMMTPHHVESLLEAAVRQRAEFMHSRTRVELGTGAVLLGSPELRRGQVTHGAVFYSAGLRHLRYNPRSYLLNEPFDWNLWRRMQRAGVRIGYLDEVTYLYYPTGPTRTAMARAAGLA